MHATWPVLHFWLCMPEYACDAPCCGRCWNYSTRVGHDAEHAQLCERCAPVIRGMGFQLPSNGVAAAAAAEPAAVTL